ncbi:hypothetical protein N1851_032697 [Merluccius polli]|uniref:Uncharacterized protein n=1 Tax=Merluccius polli TaxID=89951 RepID=A0AA47M2I9_MERPO|nr:hypothetical protein N1851_032697 [Merluccius polli]
MGLAPDYIADLLTSYEPERTLRSSGGSFLAIPWSNLKTKGDRAFSILAPRLWNDLPEEIRVKSGWKRSRPEPGYTATEQTVEMGEGRGQRRVNIEKRAG